MPIMAVLYLLGGAGSSASAAALPAGDLRHDLQVRLFFPNAILGGGLGYALKTAISQGVKRGLFSNEAGMGSTPHAHAMAKVKNPA